MGYLYAIQAAFLQNWKEIIGTSNFFIFSLMGSVPTVILLAWLTRESSSPTVLAYIAIGASLMVVWNSATWRIGWSLALEVNEGTLEFNLVSRTPLMFTMLGKALALSTFGALAGLVSLGLFLLVAQQPITIAHWPLLVVSLIVAMLALITCGFILTPLLVLGESRPGSLNAVLPFGVVFSGFVHPIDLLPASLKPLAWCLPTAWAMDGSILAIEGASSPWEIVLDWLVAGGLILVYLGLTQWLFRKVEMRVRRTGSLTQPF